MKAIVVFFLMLGAVFLLLDSIVNAQPPRVEYKYLPREHDTYLKQIPFGVTDYSKIFQSIQRPTPGVNSAATTTT